MSTTFTPLFNDEQQLLHASYTRKISALQRSLTHLNSLESLTTLQAQRLREVKKDLMVFRGKRTKLERMCVLF